jgi:DNA-binding CsgD family transcriptional regulator
MPVFERDIFERAGLLHCLTAARESIALALVLVRLTGVTNEQRVSAPTDRDRAGLADALVLASRWGDLVGRGSDDDFLLLARVDDDPGAVMLADAIHTRSDAFDEQHGARLHVHVAIDVLDERAPGDLRSRVARADSSMSAHMSGLHGPCVPSRDRCRFMITPSTPAVTGVPSMVPDALLSERERQVLRLLVARLSYREISDELFISVNTVTTHVRHVYEKLGVNSRREAIAVMQQHRLHDAGVHLHTA